MVRFLRNAVVVCFILVSIAKAQQRLHVDQRNMYERVMCIVPMTGAGTHADPRRPLYAPNPVSMGPIIQTTPASQVGATSRDGILAYHCVPSDDGKLSLCEFVAKDRSAFKQILADSTVKSFLKGKDKVEDIVAEFTKHKKDFDITHFGVRMP